MKGKLIVIEGTDSSGKETQSKLLYQYLLNKGIPCRIVHFPNYDSPSSSLVKMYLAGEFGTEADSVSPYVASIFYAGDRYASWKTDWMPFYEQGGVIIVDRYVMSNLIHQASKLNTTEEKNGFRDWLYDLEFQIFSLPKPDMTIFLHVDIDLTFALMEERLNKITSEEKKDIHEKNYNYMKRSYETACYFSKEEKWEIVDCMLEGEMKPIDVIHGEIISLCDKGGLI
jgi:dTMP kinase